MRDTPFNAGQFGSCAQKLFHKSHQDMIGTAEGAEQTSQHHAKKSSKSSLGPPSASSAPLRFNLLYDRV